MEPPTTPPGGPVRRAGAEDCDDLGRMLHDFNTEYGDPTPGPVVLARRMRDLIAGGDTVALLAGDGPDGLAVLRFRPAIWAEADECYLAELYVVPERRGHGLGRALMEAVLAAARERRCAWIDLGTSEDDTAARGLYTAMGFTNREGGPDGPVMLVYERDL